MVCVFIFHLLAGDTAGIVGDNVDNDIVKVNLKSDNHNTFPAIEENIYNVGGQSRINVKV